MKPNRRRRERPNPSAAPGAPRPSAPRGGRPGKPPRGRQREDAPVTKEHPQYGNRIPAEELEFMRQQAEERARERKNRPPGTRPSGPRPYGGGAGRYGTGEGAPRGPHASRHPGGPPRGPHRGGPPHGGPPHAGRAPYGNRTERAPYANRAERPAYGNRGERAPYGNRAERGPRGDVPYAPRDRGSRPPRGTERERVPYGPPRERFPGAPQGRPDRPDRRPTKPYRTGVPSAGEGPPRGVPIPEEPPLARLQGVLAGYQESAALLAAHQLGVFPEIQKKPQVAADLARRLECDPRGLEVLLEALVVLGLLHRHGATYVLPRDLAPYLSPGFASGLVEAAPELYAAWGDLARAVREGAPRVRLNSDALVEGDPARVRRYIRAVHTVSREAAARVAELAPLLPGATLLDVAGGSGIFGAEYARRTPELKATLFDLPPTIEVAREILREEGLEDLVTPYPGDYRSDEFPGPVDAIVLSNVLQTESEENGREILRRCREALRPGGTLLVHGVMPGSAGPVTPGQALFAVRMFLVFDAGRPWSADQIAEWLATEGFGVRSTRPLGAPFQSTLIVASRLD